MMQVDWVQFLQTFGLAVFILVAVGFAIYHSARWFGREIVIPARDIALKRFNDFLEHIEKTVSKLDVNVDTVTDNLERQTESLEQLQVAGARAHEGTERVAAALETEHTNLHSVLAVAIAENKAKQEALLNEIRDVKAEIKELHAVIMLARSEIARLEPPKKE